MSKPPQELEVMVNAAMDAAYGRQRLADLRELRQAAERCRKRNDVKTAKAYDAAASYLERMPVLFELGGGMEHGGTDE